MAAVLAMRQEAAIAQEAIVAKGLVVVFVCGMAEKCGWCGQHCYECSGETLLIWSALLVNGLDGCFLK
ncbi:hypothetical protein NL676_017056 [Syzygium grande]|nr:hypothetical protein NL676_017056 [Syzygium grande]